MIATLGCCRQFLFYKIPSNSAGLPNDYDLFWTNLSREHLIVDDLLLTNFGGLQALPDNAQREKPDFWATGSSLVVRGHTRLSGYPLNIN